jgi:hypothetical protein
VAEPTANTAISKKVKKIAKKAAKKYFDANIGDASVAHADNATNAENATNATNAEKLDGKDADQFLAAGTIGVPVAGANVAANGTVRKSFNREGGPPSVAHAADSGVYTLTFPGLAGQASFNNSIALVSLGHSGAAVSGEISVGSSSGNASVITRNSAGATADREFEFVLFVPGG